MIPLVGAAARRACRTPMRAMDPPRRDEPGHPRLGADARRRDARRAGRRDARARPRPRSRAFAGAHRDQVAAARTLTQHAVPTTVGAARGGLAARRPARASSDCEAARRACPRSSAARRGTLASFVELVRTPDARGRPARRVRRRARPRRARRALAHRPLAGHRARRRARAGDRRASACIAADVATLGAHRDRRARRGRRRRLVARCRRSRTPSASVLIRSAALRAPQLGATAAPRRRRSPSTSARTARGTPSGRRCASCCGSRSARPARRARSPTGCGRRRRRRAQPRADAAGSSSPSGSRIVLSRCIGTARVDEIVSAAPAGRRPRRRSSRRCPRQPISTSTHCSTRPSYTGLARSRSPTPRRAERARTQS